MTFGGFLTQELCRRQSGQPLLNNCVWSLDLCGPYTAVRGLCRPMGVLL